MGKRLLLLVAATIFLALAAEGVLSIFFARSFTELFPGRFTERDEALESLWAQNLSLEAELAARAARTPGPYRVHEDPFVGYAFKQNAELEYAAKRFSTDDLGLRVRPGPSPGPDAFRIALLGDSVAFGHGLEEGETIAAQLETILREVRGPKAREVACLTVAVPSWNYRNALRFLLDHLDVLDPDLVLYMEIDNDIDDSYGANEIGQRRVMEDAGALDPLLNFRSNQAFFNRGVLRLRDEGRSLDRDSFGPPAAQAALTFSSSWRIEDLARSLVDAQEILATRDARLALLPYVQHALHRQVRARLARLGARIPSIPLFEDIRTEDTLGADPHPNAASARTFAIWIAATLFEWGWLPYSPFRPLPDVDPRHEGRRTREKSDAEVLEWTAEFERASRESLERTISNHTLQGVLQIYGGINADGSFGPRLAAVLPAGRLLRVELAPLVERPDLYPLEIQVEVDGTPVGSVLLSAAVEGPAARDFALPAEAASRPFEVRLLAQRWCVHEGLVVSARFLALHSRD